MYVCMYVCLFVCLFFILEGPFLVVWLGSLAIAARAAGSAPGAVELESEVVDLQTFYGWVIVDCLFFGLLRRAGCHGQWSCFLAQNLI